MKAVAKSILLMVFGISILTSCKKNDLGGDATVAAIIKHHDEKIYGATLYIKFGTKSKPTSPTSDYDLKLIGDADENHIHVEGLRYGKYYFYAVGYDSTINQTVIGGVPVEIKYSERKSEIDVNVPVTED